MHLLVYAMARASPATEATQRRKLAREEDNQELEHLIQGMWERSHRNPTYAVLYRQFACHFPELPKQFTWLPKPEPVPDRMQDAPPQWTSHKRRVPHSTVTRRPQQHTRSSSANKSSSDDDKQPLLQYQPQAPSQSTQHHPHSVLPPPASLVHKAPPLPTPSRPSSVLRPVHKIHKVKPPPVQNHQILVLLLHAPSCSSSVSPPAQVHIDTLPQLISPCSSSLPISVSPPSPVCQVSLPLPIHRQPTSPFVSYHPISVSPLPIQSCSSSVSSPSPTSLV